MSARWTVHAQRYAAANPCKGASTRKRLGAGGQVLRRTLAGQEDQVGRYAAVSELANARWAGQLRPGRF